MSSKCVVNDGTLKERLGPGTWQSENASVTYGSSSHLSSRADRDKVRDAIIDECMAISQEEPEQLPPDNDACTTPLAARSFSVDDVIARRAAHPFWP
ncbi:Hypp4145 [Branchiostoma lanceolatum]|uniref:Hypp4145 protein n=1 Tax=Branchiostoma lanceolatum TaxID=7740 RepID=A0A8K0EWR6_BRALA|nr:Hypp4145 [Branchiostoma lanceolatum]